ncbi:MAG: hypothetical protein AB7S78_13120 [Candidatus Omnitrophota bacterium]
MPDTIKIADYAFSRIQEAFAHLETRIYSDDPADLCMDILRQDGLQFDVKLKLQNEDELSLSAGYFGNEWSPCTDEYRVKEYIRAVSGLLSGEFRIVESYQGDKPVKAELQAYGDTGWNTLYLKYSLTFPMPWLEKTTKILQNTNTIDR